LQFGDVTIIPDLGITGTYIPIWIAHTIFGLPLAIFLLHNFLAQIPRELIEAARVDGAGWFTLFSKIVLPLSVPAIASFAIFQFLWVWNDLLVGLTFGGGKKEVAPMTIRLAEMVGTRGSGWELLTAGAFVSMTPQPGEEPYRAVNSPVDFNGYTPTYGPVPQLGQHQPKW
jgi:alpha-glucoside transport system permease protein